MLLHFHENLMFKEEKTLALFVEISPDSFSILKEYFRLSEERKDPNKKQAEFQTRIKQRVFPGCGRGGRG